MKYIVILCFPMFFYSCINLESHNKNKPIVKYTYDHIMNNNCDTLLETYLLSISEKDTIIKGKSFFESCTFYQNNDTCLINFGESDFYRNAMNLSIINDSLGIFFKYTRSSPKLIKVHDDIMKNIAHFEMVVDTTEAEKLTLTIKLDHSHIYLVRKGWEQYRSIDDCVVCRKVNSIEDLEIKDYSKEN